MKQSLPKTTYAHGAFPSAKWVLINGTRDGEEESRPRQQSARLWNQT